VSFLWAAASHRRHKVRMMVALQSVAAVFVLLIAAAPRSGPGLALLVAAVVGARLCWAGVVTLRPTVWMANYPRHSLARLAGRFTAIQSVALTLSGLAIGLAMDADPESFRLLYPVAAACGLAGAWLYGGVRLRGHRAMLQAEAGRRGSPWNPLGLRRLLLEDRDFRTYMSAMFVFGSGNLMVNAPLVIILRDRFEFDPFACVLIATSIPTLMMPLVIPFWSRLLDRVRIVRFRAVHSWTFTASTAAVLAGAVAGQAWLLWVGAVIRGIAFGGGVLGWNLGHHEFATPEQSAHYMGAHVTLTGIRGLLAPIIGVSLYETLEWLRPGSGSWALALSLALTLAGAVWFVVLSREGA
jgi:MFS family permease